MIAATLALALVALAFGAFASLQFAWQWTIGNPTTLSSAITLGMVVAAAVWFFRSTSRRLPRSSVSPGKGWVVLGLAFAFGSYWMLQDVIASPLGGWDGWGIWNLHARFLSRGDGETWRNLFDPALFWSHNDYPLLLPALVSGLWTVVGSENYWAPASLTLVFAFLPIAIVACAASVCAGDQRGWLAGLVLLASPGFLSNGTAQMADVPLSCYMLITVVCIQCAELWPDVRYRMFGLAGLASGFAAWTKNEGLLILMAVVVAYGLSAVVLRSWRSARKDVIAFGICLAPVLILIVAFKAILAPPNDLQLTDSSWARFVDPGRYAQVGVAFARYLAKIGSGVLPEVIMPPAFGMLALLFLYAAPIRRVTAASLTLALVPLMTLGGYFMVYISTPNNLRAHLDSSLDRLLLHLWPAIVFIVAVLPASMSARRVEEGRLDRMEC
jgi:hypothetical protein